jgi:hypothetical protein
MGPRFPQVTLNSDDYPLHFLLAQSEGSSVLSQLLSLKDALTRFKHQ